MNTPLVGLDWGSTRLRAYRFDEAGAVAETRALPWGSRQLPEGGFEEAFARAVEGWPRAPVLACGMVGSRGGWREAPYLDTPCRLAALAGALTAVDAPDGRTLLIVPGLRDPTGPDVMRGEETQVAGVLAQSPAPADDVQLLMPGTHSKWVRVHRGAVTGFTTLMTGELFALLRGHSVLGAGLPADGTDDEAFALGVAAARTSGAAGGLSRLFSARALMLEGALAPASVADFLSGLLIGDELRMALAGGWAAPGAPVQVVGEDALCARYLLAAPAFGLALQRTSGAAAAAGLWQVAATAGLLHGHPHA
ncbi:MAG TPA: 2-dehydro-3-deoxygalactonokinase [Frateuria sp.]|uniref:2-dehydro-3-deoxygalactonokinase n=1 Tax=Frateuria sp. TaxID=2211372 RepID=UPI002D7EA125|nr:2-dehydro-3-deoxygalactonokinase [Frateuria sp.]HET6805934.1 2-dehydro-3-deoxygalactonokinase [Frateuria sp.]